MNNGWKLVPSVWLNVGDIINFMFNREWFVGVIVAKDIYIMNILCESKIIEYPVCGLEKRLVNE